jgi:WD40 repeat protein
MAQQQLYKDVFISYSHEDKDFVHNIFSMLENRGRDAWVDWEDIPVTADWWKEICTGIEAAHTFIFVISPDSISSPICNFEVAHAIQHNKRIVPVVRRDVEETTAFGALAAHNLDKNMLATLAGRDILSVARDNWQTISRHNWLFFKEDTGFDKSFEKLIAAIDLDLDYVHMHTRLLVRAKEWVDGGRDTSHLLTGKGIDTAEQWQANSVGKNPSLTVLHAEYILASRTNQRKRAQYRMAAVSIALVITIILAVVALILGDEASKQATRADLRAKEAHSLALSGNAQQEFLSGNYMLALPLAFESYRVNPQSLPAERTLQQVVYDYSILQYFEEHKDWVLSVALSSDGQYALSGSVDNTVILWETETGQVIRHFTGHTDNVLGVDFSPDGQYALSGSADNTMILWDVMTGEQIGRFQGHESGITSVTFSPDGKYALSSSWDKTIVLWDVLPSSSTFGEALKVMKGHKYSVTNVAFSPDGQTALSGGCGRQTLQTNNCAQGELILWDIETGESIRRFGGDIDGHSDEITSVVFEPGGRFAVSGSRDNTLILWWVDRGEPIRTFTGHQDDIESVTIGPNGDFIISGSADGNIIMWNTDTGDSIRILKGHLDRVFSVDFSSDGKSLLSGSWDNSLILWNLLPNGLIRTFEGTAYINSVAISPNGAFAVSGDDDYNLILWNLETGTAIYTLEGHMDQVLSVTYSPNGEHILSGSRDGTMILWDAMTGSIQHRYENPIYTANNYPDITSVAFSSDGRQIVSGAYDGNLTLWDVETENIIFQFRDGHDEPIHSVAFSSNGQQIISGGQDSLIQLWDVDTGEIIRTFRGHINYIQSVAFSPDGQYILSSADDKAVILWDIATGEKVRQFTGHAGTVWSVDFSPDASMILSGSADNTLILWDIETGNIIRRFEWHTGDISSATFSFDGYHILASSGDDTLSLWQIDSVEDLVDWVCINRYVRNFTEEEYLLYSINDETVVCDNYPSD